MDVWQRGASSLTATTSGAYTADGWIVLPTGASVTCSQVTNNRSGALSLYALKVLGATSVTDIIVKQRIESYIAAPLAGQTVTVQAQVYNNTGGSITPKLTVKHAASQDSWSSPTTDVNAVSLQSCANAAWTQIAYSFTSSSGNGLEIGFDFGNNFGSSSDYIYIAELDVRVTPGATESATNSSPPPPELRPIFAELPWCQRYFLTSYDLGTAPGTATVTGAVGGPTLIGSTGYSAGPTMVFFPVQMRADPSISYWDTAGNASKASTIGNTSSLSVASTNATLAAGPGNISQKGFMFNGYQTGSNLGTVIQYTASAEL
jgi:hypothetical protein